MGNSYKNNLKILLLSPYPDNIKKIIEHQGDKVSISTQKLELNYIKKNKFDFIISFGYRFLIKKEIIDELKGSVVNLHISYLPFNRGSHPNLWSHIEDTISGVTIHLVDEGLDTGNILFQKEVSINKNEHTFLSSYKLLKKEIERLFELNWKYIRTNECIGWKQQGIGSYHSKKDFETIKPFLKNWDTKINKVKLNFLKFNS